MAIQTPARMSQKQPKPHILELFSTQNICYTVAKVDTVALCDRYFRQAITDTKKSNEYRLF